MRPASGVPQERLPQPRRQIPEGHLAVGQALLVARPALLVEPEGQPRADVHEQFQVVLLAVVGRPLELDDVPRRQMAPEPPWKGGVSPPWRRISSRSPRRGKSLTGTSVRTS